MRRLVRIHPPWKKISERTINYFYKKGAHIINYMSVKKSNKIVLNNNLYLKVFLTRS